MTVSEYCKELQSYEEYSFSLEEVIANVSNTEVSIRRELSRLVLKKELINLRKGFYLIIPARYSRSQKLPLPLYVDKLFKYLNRNYYLGLFSAAKIHGASHQQSQRDYLIIEKPKLNNINKGTYDLQFHTTRYWPSDNIETKKSEAGIYKASSPALTFVDLIHHHTRIGGLNRILPPLEELTEVLKESDFEKLLSWYDSKSTLQRTGFLLDEILGANPFSEIVFENLHPSLFYPVLLSPKTNEKPRSVNNRWKIDLNLALDSDL